MDINKQNAEKQLFSTFILRLSETIKGRLL